MFAEHTLAITIPTRYKQPFELLKCGKNSPKKLNAKNKCAITRLLEINVITNSNPIPIRHTLAAIVHFFTANVLQLYAAQPHSLIANLIPIALLV